MKKALLAYLLSLPLQLFSAQPEWIAMQVADTIISSGIDAPLVSTLPGHRKVGMYTLPWFQKTFIIRHEVKKASARVCGLGHFEFQLNGTKVGNHFLDPGWTLYDKEALYVDFDVTEMLQKGKNTIDVMLGGGFYNIPQERYFKLITSYGPPKLWMEVKIEYGDGTLQEIVTDCRTWKVARSPVTYSSIFGGESYDARLLERPRWQKPVPAPTDIHLREQNGTQLTVRSTLPYKRYFKDSGSCWIYDLGQNFSGVVEIEVRGQRGRQLELWPAELLDDKGDLFQKPIGTPYHWDYTLCGDVRGETWKPQFTYYGQRYIKVVGAVPEGVDNPQGLPEIINVTGLHTCADVAETGSFSCSDTLFSKIHTLIDWAIRSNTQSVITDCPHREKLGWMEQDYLMQHSIQYRYNVLPLYRKLLHDMETSQWDNGCIPTIAPMYVKFANGFEDTPEWGSAFIICPWYAYRWYGDRTLIEDHYPAMCRYIDYLTSRADGHIIAYGLGDWYDIGPGEPGYAQLTSNGATASGIYYYDVSLMARMARLLGKDDDARKYDRLAEDIRSAYNARFYHREEGYYDLNSQTANAIALYFGLVEDSQRQRVLDSLVSDIRSRGYALTAGDIGYRFVIQALQEAGRSDVVYLMNSRTDVPGYGWQLRHGATSLTESWQAYANASNNHLMLGHLMEWLYGGLCGIRQTKESVAFQHLLISPAIIPEIGEARASLQTPYGEVVSSWKLQSGNLHIEVLVPEGCDAIVTVPEYGVDMKVDSGSHSMTVPL